MGIFQQKSKVGVAGGFINQLMANNSSIPEIGKGATILHYSDRSPYEVIEVSDDLKTVKLEALDHEWDQTKPGGMGHQNWILKPSGRFSTVVWKWGKWRFKGSKIVFTQKFIEESKAKNILNPYKALTLDQREEIYNGDCQPQKVIEGITEKNVVYSEVKILFGKKEYYYDWEF